MSPAPDVGEVAWQLAGHNENCVDADVVSRPCIARRKSLGGGGNAAKAIFVEGQGCRIITIALLDLDEGNHFSAPRDQVDFAARNSCAPRQDSPTVQTEPPGGHRFRAPATGFRDVAVQALPAKSSALA